MKTACVHQQSLVRVRGDVSPDVDERGNVYSRFHSDTKRSDGGIAPTVAEQLIPQDCA